MNIEILAPGGGEPSARAALLAGADAIYLGLRRFSARGSAENFGAEEFSRTVRFAHLLGAKVYVALNTLVKDSETEDFFAQALAAWNGGADAILVQDLFLGAELKRRYPQMVLHLSTQAGCCNPYGAQTAKEYGFTRAVLARETPLAEIEKISKIIETEVFVQGALCAAFSGQCYFSSFAGNNSGNRGLCKQPCRKRYRIDRAGFGSLSYALSLSDLSVGRRIRELAEAGVTSFKIEGRMRRSEYAAAAVSYYRALLGGEDGQEELSLLRRAYNRGDYTEGLAFGQKKDLHSRLVQGHIGERIGTVSFRHGMPVCLTTYAAEEGDGFKILREGREVGGASFRESTAGGFSLRAGCVLQEGDEVRLTTSLASNRAALATCRLRPIDISLRFVAGELPRAEAEGLVFEGEDPLPAARSAPLDEDGLRACFLKTDGLPLEPRISVVTEGAFLPKSALNAFRRDFYAALADRLAPARESLSPCGGEVVLTPERGKLTARIGKGGACDILVYSPSDYGHIVRPAGEQVYLRLPPFLSGGEIGRLKPAMKEFDGIYCDGYYGIALARETGLPLFAGTGWNLTNRFAVKGAGEVARYFALSKELSEREQNALSAKGAFALSGGDIRVMDLAYCPFSKTCASCDRREFYRLTDEDGRVFPLRRYCVSDMVCRFEVYNCAALAPFCGMASRLFDDGALPVRGGETTKGHTERSML